MADHKANHSTDTDAELIVAVDDGRFENLACDQVVLDWLLNLEAEDSATDLDEARRKRTAQHAHC